jgi:hypothetical protein
MDTWLKGCSRSARSEQPMQAVYDPDVFDTLRTFGSFESWTGRSGCYNRRSLRVRIETTPTSYRLRCLRSFVLNSVLFVPSVD